MLKHAIPLFLLACVCLHADDAADKPFLRLTDNEYAEYLNRGQSVPHNFGVPFSPQGDDLLVLHRRWKSGPIIYPVDDLAKNNCIYAQWTQWIERSGTAWETSFRWLQKTAEQGYAPAQYELGLCYGSGRGVKKDANKAVYWMEQAARQEYRKTQYSLANPLEIDGDFIPDRDTARAWEKAAKENLRRNDYFEVKNKFFVRFPGQTHADRVQKLQNASDAGDLAAKSHLALHCYLGNGTKSDPKRAGQLWKELAEKGDSQAQYALGVCGLRGEADVCAESDAARWLEMSAAQGNVPAQYAMGMCRLYGHVFPQDRTAAVAFLKKAAAANYMYAKEVLRTLDARMPPQ